MRDFTKNLFSFSWAMSLFGLKQLGNVLNPRETLRGAPDAARSFDSVTDAVVDQFGRTLKQTFEVGDRVQGEIVDLMFGFLGVRPDSSGKTGTGTGAWGGTGAALQVQPAIFSSCSSAGEVILIASTRGQGQFSDDRRFIALKNRIYNLDGSENGLYESVLQALFKSPMDLLARPAPPAGSMFEPVGTVPGWPASANTISRWTQADGSSISSVGPAAAQLVALSDGSMLFLGATAHIITEGTGRFAGARGLTQSLSATAVPADSDMFSPQGPAMFPVVTLDIFRFLAGPPAGGGRWREEGSRTFTGDSGAGKVGSGVEGLADFAPAKAGPHDSMLLRYCNGRGRFSQDKKLLSLQMRMFDPYGRPDGSMAGVWQVLFTNSRQLLNVPPQPRRPYNPAGPVPGLEPAANTKATWTFDDGSSITAVGPATLTLVQLSDGSSLLLAATTQWITNGTGRWAGAQGLKSSLVATHIPAGADLFGPDCFEIEATSVDTFRVAPGSSIGEPPKP